MKRQVSELKKSYRRIELWQPLLQSEHLQSSYST